MSAYVIALYIRLSIEDVKYESMSIENQKLTLHDFASAPPEAGHAEILEFVDNGYLYRFPEDWNIPVSNNQSENAIRPFTFGRKSGWHFLRFGHKSLRQCGVLFAHCHCPCKRYCAVGVSHKTVFRVFRDGCTSEVIMQNVIAPPVFTLGWRGCLLGRTRDCLAVTKRTDINIVMQEPMSLFLIGSCATSAYR